MGYYIDGPAKGKAVFIKGKYGADIISTPAVFNVPAGKALICVVDNGPFEAAAYCFNVREFKAFSDHADPRPKKWLLMDRSKAEELTGYVSPEPEADKGPDMAEFLDEASEALLGRTLSSSLIDNICVSCGKPAGEFNDALSKKEYGISGLCQKCQDIVFGH